MRKAKSLRLNIILITLSLFISILIITHNVSALEYQSNTGVQFTINPTITISITGDHNGNLVINNLTPSNASDSNIINIVTESNAISGYSLYSTVGSDSNGTSTGNPSTELRRNGTDTTNKFTSITTNKSSLSDFNGSDWGYSYSTDSGTTWISGDITSTTATGYNGLPLYTTESPIKLINTTTSGSSSVQFKIGAKASNSQIAGDYTNTINFIGVANPNPPVVYMQNATMADCGKDMVDSRDNTIYTTALLENGQCWMTKNLDLPGGIALSADDTDVTSTYINGFTTGGNLTKVGNTIVLPASSTTGFDDDTKAFVYNSGRTATSDSGCSAPGCFSYYSWIAATLGGKASDGSTAVTADNTDTAASICPKGWRLPNTRGGTNDTSDFRKLMILLGGSSAIQTYDSTTTPTGATIFNGLSGTPLSFLRAGYYDGSTFDRGGGHGYYWPSTSASSTYARYLAFSSTSVRSAYSNSRRYGFSVRCVKSS